MNRLLTAAAIALAMSASPAHAQGGKAKADSGAKAGGKQPPATATSKPAPPAAKAPAMQAPAQSKAPASAQQAPASAKGTSQGTKAPAKQAEAAPKGDSREHMTLEREVFSYGSGGRRDPALSLMNTTDIRPLITEVQVIGIVYDEEGTNSTALLRNTVDKKTQYHVKVGQMLGRMKVTQITRKEVVFTIDEFGFSRQERLSVKPDTTVARTP